MLKNISDLKNYAISASDGEIGHLKDFYFDDKSWVVRYLVVETGSWLFSRKVLISPIAINHINWDDKLLSIHQSKEQIKNSPDIDTDKPVSRQHEIIYNGYYNYPLYWGGGGLWGVEDYPTSLLPNQVTGNANFPRNVGALTADEIKDTEKFDPHLRSFDEISRYKIQTPEGEIGHVKGFLVNEANWLVRYLVVDTNNWWPSHGVLVEIGRLAEVRWADKTIVVNLSRESIKDAPSYDSSRELTYEDELALQRHYDQLGYGLTV